MPSWDPSSPRLRSSPPVAACSPSTGPVSVEDVLFLVTTKAADTGVAEEVADACDDQATP